MSLLDASFSALAGPSQVASAEPSEEVDRFQRRASPLKISPRHSLSEWLDALNDESGEDARGPNTRFSSCGAPSRKEAAACVPHTRPDAGSLDARVSCAAEPREQEAASFHPNPGNRSSVRGNLAVAGA